MNHGFTKEPDLLGLLLLILFSLLLFPPSSRAEGGISCFPNVIQVTTFFHGTWVKIYGKCPSGSKVLVEVGGEDEREVLMKKGKYGPLWMNVAEIRIDKAPNFYLLLGPVEKVPVTVPNETDFPNGKHYGYGQLLQESGSAGRLWIKKRELGFFRST
jgi:hypothetical protein